MKTVRLIIFLVVALAQVSVPASMIWKRQRILRAGRVWKFRTAPIDPVDALRGRYLSLRFAAERSSRAEPLSFGEGLAFVSLKNDADGFAIVDEVGYEPRRGDNIIRAEYYGFYEGKVNLRFPFDRFWVSEGDAIAAENAYQAHKDDGCVTVRVGDGDAAIEELYLAGKPLREYLRANSIP